MNKFFVSMIAGFVGFLVLMTVLTSTWSRVPAGYVGVKVHLLGGSKGVDAEEVGPGYHWLGWNQEMHLFPTFTQNYCWTKANDPKCGSPNNEEYTFQTIEGMVVHADIGITYRVKPVPGAAANLFQKFRKGIDEITDIYIRNIVRDSLVSIGSTKTNEEVYGKGKVEIMTEVEKTVRSIVTSLNIEVENIYWIGEIRMPQSVVKSLNDKIEATQRAQQRQNEVAESKAEAEKKIEEARGRGQSVLIEAQKQAEANQVLAKSITPELIQYRALERWDGIACRMACGASAGAMPLIQVDPSMIAPKKAN